MADSNPIEYYRAKRLLQTLTPLDNKNRLCTKINFSREKLTKYNKIDVTLPP